MGTMMKQKCDFQMRRPRLVVDLPIPTILHVALRRPVQNQVNIPDMKGLQKAKVTGMEMLMDRRMGLRRR